MNELQTILGVFLFPAGCTALGAAAVFMLRKPPCSMLQRGMLGFVAGIMFAASVWSLLLPAIDYAQTQLTAAGGALAWVAPVGGFCVGASGLFLFQHYGSCLLFMEQ